MTLYESEGNASGMRTATRLSRATWAAVAEILRPYDGTDAWLSARLDNDEVPA